MDLDLTPDAQHPAASATDGPETPKDPPQPSDPDDTEKTARERAEFARMLEQYSPGGAVDTPAVGSKVQGRIVVLGEETSFVDFGGRSEGAVETRLLRNEKGEIGYHVGDSIELIVISDHDPIALGTSIEIETGDAVRAVREARAQNLPVTGKIISLNAGGLEVQVAGLRGFCPFSQIEIGYCAEPSALIGKSLEFLVEKIDEKGRTPNLVLSRKALLLRGERERTAQLLETLSTGQQLEGVVTRLQPFGAFVDLGGAEGMVHVSEIRHGRVEHPSEVLKEGDRVSVKVLNIERIEGKRPRIALSIKAAAPDPWNEAGEQFWEGKKVSGTVVRLAPFGAFVELTPGIEGLVHVSEIANRPLRDPSEELTVGQRVDVSVLKVDPQKRRISLSIRDLLPAVAVPASEDAPASEPAAPQSPERAPHTGDVVDAVVRNIKPYGIFADLPIYGPRVSGLIPHDETGERRGTDLARRFKVGDPLKVYVLDATAGKIRLSLTALQSQEEKRGFEEFRSRSATRGSSTAMEDAFRRAQGKH